MSVKAQTWWSIALVTHAWVIHGSALVAMLHSCAMAIAIVSFKFYDEL